jgi:hypothetical protein
MLDACARQSFIGRQAKLAAEQARRVRDTHVVDFSDSPRDDGLARGEPTQAALKRMIDLDSAPGEARNLLVADPAINSGIFVAMLERWRPRFRSGTPLPH